MLAVRKQCSLTVGILNVQIETECQLVPTWKKPLFATIKPRNHHLFPHLHGFSPTKITKKSIEIYQFHRPTAEPCGAFPPAELGPRPMASRGRGRGTWLPGARPSRRRSARRASWRSPPVRYGAWTPPPAAAAAWAEGGGPWVPSRCLGEGAKIGETDGFFHGFLGVRKYLGWWLWVFLGGPTAGKYPTGHWYTAGSLSYFDP